MRIDFLKYDKSLFEAYSVIFKQNVEFLSLRLGVKQFWLLLPLLFNDI